VWYVQTRPLLSDLAIWQSYFENRWRVEPCRALDWYNFIMMAQRSFRTSKIKQKSDHLLASVEAVSCALPVRPVGGHSEDDESDTASLTNLANQAICTVPDTSRIPRMKRFRFQLLQQWMVANLPPCRVADVGGGKGLMGYLLQKSGFQATVIDPVQQPLPDKYKDILTGQRVKIMPEEQVPCIPAEFEPDMGRDFDMLLAMHAHGCNVKIIDAAAAYGCGFIIFPCCVIGEPFYPRLGVHWLESLAGYAVLKGHALQALRLNFKGQNIGLFCAPRRYL